MGQANTTPFEDSRYAVERLLAVSDLGAHAPFLPANLASSFALPHRINRPFVNESLRVDGLGAQLQAARSSDFRFRGSLLQPRANNMTACGSHKVMCAKSSSCKNKAAGKIFPLASFACLVTITVYAISAPLVGLRGSR